MKVTIEERVEEFRQKQREKEEAEHRQRYTCSVCNSVFVSVYAKNQHFRASHVYEYDYVLW